MSRVWIPVYLAAIVAYVLLCACMGNPPDTPPVVSPALEQAQPSSGTSVDITNQNSPQAATFRNGASYTPLVTPQPLLRLAKVAEGFSSLMMIVLPHDGSGRMAVVDQIGVVMMIGPDKKVSDTPFLDVRLRRMRPSLPCVS
jgi:hypothetical protein